MQTFVLLKNNNVVNKIVLPVGALAADVVAAQYGNSPYDTAIAIDPSVYVDMNFTYDPASGTFTAPSGYGQDPDANGGD